MSIEGLVAVLLISPGPERLARFYRDVVGLPFESEQHDVAPPHWGCDVDGVHFAIHPSEGWPGDDPAGARSPVIALRTDDVGQLALRLAQHGVTYSGPRDHGWGLTITFIDLDGNRIEVIEMTPQVIERPSD